MGPTYLWNWKEPNCTRTTTANKVAIKTHFCRILERSFNPKELQENSWQPQENLNSYYLKECEVLCGKWNFQILECCYIYEDVKIA